MLNKKSKISLVCILILTIFGVHFFIKADKRTDLWMRIIFGSLFLLLPLLIPSIVWIFKKHLFHPLFWFFSICMFGLIYFIIQYQPEVQPYENKDFVVTIRYFENHAGFFTNYRSLITFDEDIDSNRILPVHTIKSMYLLGNKDLYIGKVKLDSNFNVIKVIYNKKVANDTLVARKEFGESVNNARGFYKMFPELNKY